MIKFVNLAAIMLPLFALLIPSYSSKSLKAAICVALLLPLAMLLSCRLDPHACLAMNMVGVAPIGLSIAVVALIFWYSLIKAIRSKNRNLTEGTPASKSMIENYMLGLGLSVIVSLILVTIALFHSNSIVRNIDILFASGLLLQSILIGALLRRLSRYKMHIPLKQSARDLFSIKLGIALIYTYPLITTLTVVLSDSLGNAGGKIIPLILPSLLAAGVFLVEGAKPVLIKNKFIK